MLVLFAELVVEESSKVRLPDGLCLLVGETMAIGAVLLIFFVS